MNIAIISKETADRIKDEEYIKGVKYNPIELNEEESIISLVEAQYLPIYDIKRVEEFIQPVEEEE